MRIPSTPLFSRYAKSLVRLLALSCRASKYEMNTRNLAWPSTLKLVPEMVKSIPAGAGGF